MAIACANCGTQNPDGNKFCQSCGKPLAAAPLGAAAAPAAAAPPPPAPAPAPGAAGAPPPGYSPYYAPVPGQGVTVHRTSPGLIIGIVGGLVLLMVAAMFLIGLIFLRPQPKPVANVTTHGTPAPTTPVPTTPVPQPTSTGPGPTPTPAPTQRPTPTPTPAPTPTPHSGGATIKTSSFQVSAPGWKNLKQDSQSVTLLSPQGDGTLSIAAGSLQQKTDTQTFLTTVLTDIAKKYPDAKICLKPVAETTGGKEGILVGACYTYTPSSGAAFPAADVIWADVDSSNNLFVYEVFCQVKDFDNVYNKEVLPVVETIQWAA